MKPTFVAIDGYFTDDKTEFTNYIVTDANESDILNDDDIFYYGLSLDFIKENINNENNGLEFTITNYSYIEEAKFEPIDKHNKYKNLTYTIIK